MAAFQKGDERIHLSDAQSHKQHECEEGFHLRLKLIRKAHRLAQRFIERAEYGAAECIQNIERMLAASKRIQLAAICAQLYSRDIVTFQPMPNGFERIRLDAPDAITLLDEFEEQVWPQ